MSGAREGETRGEMRGDMTKKDIEYQSTATK